MKFSYAVAAVLLAGSASASTIEGLFRRQSIQDMLAAIPPACQTPCQPLVALQTRCADDPNPTRCACTDSTVKNMGTCIDCVVKEVTSASGGGSALDPATLQTAIDTAMQTFTDACKEAGVDLGSGGSSGGSNTGTTAGTATNTSPASGASNTAGTTSNQNSGAIRAEFAATALVAIAAGAALLA